MTSVVLEDLIFFFDRVDIEGSILCIIFFEKSKFSVTFFDFDTILEQFNLSDLSDRESLRQLPAIEVSYDADALFEGFKDTSLYAWIIENFDKMHQFFKEEYELYLQEEASVDDFFDEL